MQKKIDDSESKYEETGKLSEERIKEEVPVIDQTAIIKLEAENQQLKVLMTKITILIYYRFWFFLVIMYMYLIKHSIC